MVPDPFAGLKGAPAEQKSVSRSAVRLQPTSILKGRSAGKHAPLPALKGCHREPSRPGKPADIDADDQQSEGREHIDHPRCRAGHPRRGRHHQCRRKRRRNIRNRRSYLMSSGDALLFDSAARHRPEELIEAPMQYLSIVMYPRRE
jgi:hypothetical protein